MHAIHIRCESLPEIMNPHADGHEWEGASFPFSTAILDTEMVRFKLSRNLARLDALARLGDIAIENAAMQKSSAMSRDIHIRY